MEGGRSWRYVEYLSSYPYFHVSALDSNEEGSRLSTLLIYTVTYLLDLASAAKQGWKILQVQLVSPGRMNGTGEWRMDDLQEISEVRWEARISYAYLLRSGVTYFEREEFRQQPQDCKQIVFRTTCL
ncbi:hypothetical protein [Pseudomonas denitrificans (nom. rej.)]|uniref:Uncharacterized protein n=1 Tax=Pseudomonas denitrificans TaxID=43306 RepID=A0A9X7MY39_PSEDE|nr:hypothetical protein [Pseudomonas denitrificans (nom. rej.)]QEY71747.1 hypothetical protein F1C79_08970 [Pseudomonas denitrificans (nom. rej.)]